MKEFINKKNGIMETVSKEQQLTGLKFHYYLSDNKLYKEIIKRGNVAIFRYNQDNGKFDIPVDMDNLNLTCKKINRPQFYSEVLNIIKRKAILEYMLNSNKKFEFDLKNLYISESEKRETLANVISLLTGKKFTQTDARILVDNICNSTKIPFSLAKEIKEALIETFYDKEISQKKMMLLVNKIITKELQKKLPDFMNNNIIGIEYDKMMKLRKDTQKLYSKKTR